MPLKIPKLSKFRGSTNNAGMIVAPLSTLLVTLDRIYTITLPLQHKKPLRFRLQMTCAFLLLMAFFVVTFIGFSRTYNPEKRTTSKCFYNLSYWIGIIKKDTTKNNVRNSFYFLVFFKF